jgi:hypothetical protein
MEAAMTRIDEKMDNMARITIKITWLEAPFAH